MICPPSHPTTTHNVPQVRETLQQRRERGRTLVRDRSDRSDQQRVQRGDARARLVLDGREHARRRLGHVRHVAGGEQQLHEAARVGRRD